MPISDSDTHRAQLWVALSLFFSLGAWGDRIVVSACGGDAPFDLEFNVDELWRRHRF